MICVFLYSNPSTYPGKIFYFSRILSIIHKIGCYIIISFQYTLFRKSQNRRFWLFFFYLNNKRINFTRFTRPCLILKPLINYHDFVNKSSFFLPATASFFFCYALFGVYYYILTSFFCEFCGLYLYPYWRIIIITKQNKFKEKRRNTYEKIS